MPAHKPANHRTHAPTTSACHMLTHVFTHQVEPCLLALNDCHVASEGVAVLQMLLKPGRLLGILRCASSRKLHAADELLLAALRMSADGD